MGTIRGKRASKSPHHESHGYEEQQQVSPGEITRDSSSNEKQRVAQKRKQACQEARPNLPVEFSHREIILSQPVELRKFVRRKVGKKHEAERKLIKGHPGMKIRRLWR